MTKHGQLIALFGLSTTQKFERSELDLYTFYRRFGDELSNIEKNNEAFIKFCKSRGQGELVDPGSSFTNCVLTHLSRDAEVPKLPTELHIDGREVSNARMSAVKHNVCISTDSKSLIGQPM